jgi:diguanylate cyclase
MKGRGVSARYGVQNFMVLLPETSREDATKLTESIREEMSSTAFEMTNAGLMISVTVSCGVAQIRDDDTVESVVDRAVQALSLAKKRGRNRVISE